MCYIDNTEDLIELCKEIKNTSNVIGIDTEFIKGREYFPALSLIQISFFNGKNIKNSVIDVISDEIKLDSFFKILNDEKIKKIFHSCSQDLEGLYYLSNFIVKSVEDTQIMAEFCGIRSNLGYTDLAKEILKVSIKKNKKIQISNWMKRPLTDDQLRYAVDDVDYLLDMYIYLLNKLNSNGNYNYYKAEMKIKYSENMIEHIIDNSWKKNRFKIGNKTKYYINLIKKITKIREKFSMKNNTIRDITLSDNLIKILISIQPKSIKEWNESFKDNCELLNKSNEMKKEIIEVFLQNNEVENNEKYIIDVKNIPNILHKYEEINDYIVSTCKKLEISPDIATNKLDIISYLSDSEKLEDVYDSWKIELFGKRIKDIKNR